MERRIGSVCSRKPLLLCLMLTDSVIIQVAVRIQLLLLLRHLTSSFLLLLHLHLTQATLRTCLPLNLQQQQQQQPHLSFRILRITEIFEMASRMREARDRQSESFALSDWSPGKSVANTFRHRSSSKRGHELPPLLNDDKVFLTNDTDKAELFNACFAKHLNTESDPVLFLQ
nr:unnamed protein product [Spirometra erinaceieuropaei]